mmetsp:Transcript_49707/g.105838  ORF Transcript_49707/g.105838 Transcript_49707/m.105838 type:complete len:156 (-) Transcript_49707:51-518(-)
MTTTTTMVTPPPLGSIPVPSSRTLRICRSTPSIPWMCMEETQSQGEHGSTIRPFVHPSIHSFVHFLSDCVFCFFISLLQALSARAPGRTSGKTNLIKREMRKVLRRRCSDTRAARPINLTKHEENAEALHLAKVDLIKNKEMRKYLVKGMLYMRS